MSASANNKYRHNKEPTISANHLAEYLLASPQRRQAIIRNAKYAPTVLVLRYKQAKDAITEFLADDRRDQSRLFEAENELKHREKTGQTPWLQDEARLCGEALTSFYGLLNNADLVRLRFIKPTNRLTPLTIEDVNIRINLDLISQTTIWSKEKVGGVILQTSKTITASSLREEHGKIVATLLWILTNEQLTDFGEPDRKLCFALDIFGKRLSFPPQSYKRLTKDLNAACREIKILWPVVTPPADFESSKDE